MHWRYTPDFHQFLRERSFLPIVIVRHPLDVLISILRFSQHEPATARWLDGRGGDEKPLLGAGPTSSAFIEYALSDRAAALLAVSREWMDKATVVVRYEDLVADTPGTLATILERMRLQPVYSLDTIAANHTLEQLRPLGRHHFWRGQAGVWKQLITPDICTRIQERHRIVFGGLGYNCERADAPDEAAAARSWRNLLRQGGSERESVGQPESVFRSGEAGCPTLPLPAFT
jgi:hypothetical protein